MSSTHCKGKKNLGTQCKNLAIGGEEYCETHLYFKIYTDDMMKNLQKCGRCANMFYYETLKQCPSCTSRSRKQSNEISKERKKPIKCEGITKKGTKCTYNQMSNSKYCGDHQYMNEYTDDMLKKLRQCTGCSSYRYFTMYSTCDECREYRSDKRNETKLQQVDTPKCKVINCTRNSKFGEYCGKHKRLQLCNDAEKDGYKLCGGGNHNCMNRIPLESKHIYCDECLQKHRDEDKERYEKEKRSIEEFNSEHDDMMKCIKCGKEFSIDDCVKDIRGNISKKCGDCFKKQQDIESKRPERHRDWAKWYQEFIKNPIRVARKKQWKIDNAEKIRTYWKKYREMLKETLGTDEYHSLMAEKMRSYWERNPEKRLAFNDRRRKSVVERFGYYKNSAGDRKKDWSDEMTQEICEKLFKSQCHYCGKKYVPNGYLLGIDRVDNTKGYCIDNCVACCDVCNFMKRCHSEENFIKICTHVYNKFFDEDSFDEDSNVYPDVFKGRKTVPTHEVYNLCAKQRNIEMHLNEDDIYRIVTQDCYICGHIDTDGDYNGIDRIDSNKAYQRDNCKACCATCNYLKNDLNIVEFITHIIKIVWHQDESFTFQCDAESYNQHVNSVVSFGVEHSNFIDIREPYDMKLFDAQIECIGEKHDEQKDKSIVHTAKTREEKLEYDRNKSKEIAVKQRKELGDEEFKKALRIKVGLSRGKIIGIDMDENGFAIKSKKPLSGTERSKLCRERKKQEIVQQPKKQISDIDQKILDNIKQSGIKMV